MTMTAMTGREIPEAKTNRRRKGQDGTGFGLTATTAVTGREVPEAKTTRRGKGQGDTKLGLTATTTTTLRSTPLTDLNDQDGSQVQRSRVNISSPKIWSREISAQARSQRHSLVLRAYRPHRSTGRRWRTYTSAECGVSPRASSSMSVRWTQPQTTC